MKNTTILMITGIILVVLFLLRKPINKAMTRGYKNNNPGNIRLTFDRTGKQTFWKNEIIGTDKAFKKFKTMVDGYRALFALLVEYNGKGFNTISKIINRYAPSSENNSTAYISTVSARTKIHPDSVILSSDNDTLKKIVAAISYVENGISADLTDIEKGFNLYKT